MLKFQVKSGELFESIAASDAQGAALWLMNSVMETFFPQYSPETVDSDPFVYLEDGLLLLGEEISVTDSTGETRMFDTVEIFTEWNELILAVDKLEMVLRQSGDSANRDSESLTLAN